MCGEFVLNLLNTFGAVSSGFYKLFPDTVFMLKK